jgi:Ala-tRNA(Pro) deacylase
MSIAPTLQRYLASQHIDYDLVAHQATLSSMHTAGACQIPADRLAKGVVLRTGEGYVLAVLPACHRLRRSDLTGRFGKACALATEHELDQLFPDCVHGAVPAIGECYGLDVIVEDRMRDAPEVYFEAGDHATLVHLSQMQFARLTAHAPHGHFTSAADLKFLHHLPQTGPGTSNR